MLRNRWESALQRRKEKQTEAELGERKNSKKSVTGGCVVDKEVESKDNAEGSWCQGNKQTQLLNLQDPCRIQTTESPYSKLIVAAEH